MILTYFLLSNIFNAGLLLITKCFFYSVVLVLLLKGALCSFGHFFAVFAFCWQVFTCLTPRSVSLPFPLSLFLRLCFPSFLFLFCWLSHDDSVKNSIATLLAGS